MTGFVRVSVCRWGAGVGIVCIQYKINVDRIMFVVLKIGVHILRSFNDYCLNYAPLFLPSYVYFRIITNSKVSIILFEWNATHLAMMCLTLEPQHLLMVMNDSQMKTVVTFLSRLCRNSTNVVGQCNKYFSHVSRTITFLLNHSLPHYIASQHYGMCSTEMTL